MATDTELAAQLTPVRLPESLAVASPQDLAAAFSLGLLAAVVLVLLLRPLMRRRISRRQQIETELAALRDLPAAQRLYRQTAILAALHDERGALSAGVGRESEPDSVYRPGSLLDPDDLDRKIIEVASSPRR